MKEQDIRAVESMCNCGMSLDAIVSSFPKFPQDEIEKIYRRVKDSTRESDDGVSISINCS